MVNSKTTISTLALSALTAAAPFSSNTNFSISQVPVKIPAAHPAAIYAEAHARLGVEVPHHVALAARCGWKDSVIALPYSHDIVYLTPIQFGADTLQVYLDTASGNTWAYTAETPSVGSHGVYNPQTGRLLSDYYWRSRSGQSIVFGGRVFLDKLKLNHLLYPEQAIQVVDFVQPIEVMLNPARAYDAILGLAFPEKNTVKPVKQPTFFENIREMLQAPLFAAFLRHQAPGGYDFGWIDSSKYQGSLAWTPVHASLGLWNISVSGYSIGDDVFSSTPFFAVIDTGTTLVLLEESIVQAYYQRVPDSDYSIYEGGYIFPCTETSVIPEFRLKIGHHIAIIPGKFIKFRATNSTHCYGGIQVTPRRDRNYLGDLFLKGQYVIFYGNPKNPQIGIAAQA